MGQHSPIRLHEDFSHMASHSLEFLRTCRRLLQEVRERQRVDTLAAISCLNQLEESRDFTIEEVAYWRQHQTVIQLEDRKLEVQ